MESGDYNWRMHVEFGAEMPYEAVRQFACSLDAALIEAIERTMAENCDGPVVVRITCGAGGNVERKLTFKKGYQIAEIPRAVDETTYATVAEAIVHLQALRGRRKHIAECITLVREPNGFRVGSHQRDACDFRTEAEAESALRGFHDPTRFAVIPYLEVIWEAETDA